MNIRMFPLVIVLAIFLQWPLFAAHAAQDRVTFSLPIRCELGATCWIPNYVDHKPGPGVLDYTCGDATYDAPPKAQHKGTDFAVRDMAAVRQGIAVLAVAPGQVIASRDGMQDINFKDAKNGSLKRKACGNAVRIQHDTGLITQYCHMRRGSILVKAKDRVERGQPLGLVGLSGMTAFPHLHFQVEKNKIIIDPFAGLARKKSCGAGEIPLWDKQTLAKLPYQPTAIYNAGFATQKPTKKAISAGLYKTTAFKPTVPAIVLWAEFFRVRSADTIVISIFGPQGAKIHERRLNMKKNKAYYMAYSGLRPPHGLWPPGTYQGTIALIRKDKTFSVTRRVQVR